MSKTNILFPSSKKKKKKNLRSSLHSILGAQQFSSRLDINHGYHGRFSMRWGSLRKHAFSFLKCKVFMDHILIPAKIRVELCLCCTVIELIVYIQGEQSVPVLYEAESKGVNVSYSCSQSSLQAVSHIFASCCRHLSLLSHSLYYPIMTFKSGDRLTSLNVRALKADGWATMSIFVYIRGQGMLFVPFTWSSC